MTDDDWAPLPAGETCQRPGEFADTKKREVAPPSAAPTPAPPAKPAVPDPAAERALAALVAKLAQMAPATSLIGKAAHREQRAERKQRAAGAPALAATLVQGIDPTAVPVVEYSRGLDGRDEREESEWFRALPAPEQERLHRQWATERCRFTDGGERLRLRLQRVTIGGAVVFGGLAVCQSLVVGGFSLVPIMIGVGAVAAVIAELLRGDRFVYSLCGGLAWVVVMGPMLFSNPFAMPGVMLAAYGLAAIGMEGEMLRSGGFKDR